MENDIIKGTLIIDKNGKGTLINVPKGIELDTLYDVGSLEPKRVSSLNKNLYAEAKDILEKNIKAGHIGWYSLGMLIDYLEENYDISKKESK